MSRRGMTLIELLAVESSIAVALVGSVLVGEWIGRWGYVVGAIGGLVTPLLAIEVATRLVRHRVHRNRDKD